MKKKLSIIISCCALLIACNNNRPSDLDALNLNGKVKSITIQEYDAAEKFDEIVVEGPIGERRCIDFDKDGLIIKEATSYPDGDTTIKYTHGNGITFVNVSSPEDTSDYKQPYTFKNGQLTEYIIDNNGDTITTIVTAIEKRKPQKCTYTTNGEITRVIKHVYDKCAHTIKYYDNTGTLTDERVNATNKIAFFGDGGYNGDYRGRAAFDNNSLPVWSLGAEVDWTNFARKEGDFMDTIYYSHEVDKKGNWTKRVQWREDCWDNSKWSIYITTRDITYW